MPFLLSDTVGFIRKLPHHLVESFKSTLDEVKESDLLIHVVDVAHPNFEDHIKTVNLTLKSLEALDKPTLFLFNKIDLYRERYFDELLSNEDKSEIELGLQAKLKEQFVHDNFFISAIDKENIEDVKTYLTEKITELYQIRFPYQTKQW